MVASPRPAGTCAMRSPCSVPSGRPPHPRRSPSASVPAEPSARAPDHSARRKRLHSATRSATFPFATIRPAEPSSGRSMMHQPEDSTGRYPTMPIASSKSVRSTTHSSCHLSTCSYRCRRRQPCRPTKGRRVQLPFLEVSFERPFHSLRHRRHAGSRSRLQSACALAALRQVQAMCRTPPSRDAPAMASGRRLREGPRTA